MPVNTQMDEQRRLPTYLGKRPHGAMLDESRVYRYSLWRLWREDACLSGMAAFVGLNPSTADETKDDPTIRRCIGFAQSWGLAGLVMLNIFAIRATDPQEMKQARYPIGELNDEAIKRVADSCGLVVCCWGNNGDHLGRGAAVRGLLWRQCGCAVWHLGLTKKGHPRHPLYLRSSTERIRWTN